MTAAASGDETVVPLSRSKLVLLIVGAVGFVALGVWIAQADPAWITAQRRFNDPTVVHAIGIVAIVFFGLCGVLGIRKLFDSKPGLVLSPAGIVISSSAASARTIPWRDIERFDTREIHRQKLLVVKLVDPEKYVRSGGSLQQALQRANMGLVGSPIAISANTLKISFDELLTLCNAYLAKYARSA